MPDRPLRRLAFALLIVLVSTGGLATWYYLRTDPEPPPQPAGFTPDPPTPDPRLVFDTPFRNVKPEVQYVGDDACARCHLPICKSYHAHPMGRSAAEVTRATPIERYDPSGRTAFAAGSFDLEVERSAGEVRHRVRPRGQTETPVSELVLPAHVAIGSGTRGRSYLTVEKGAVWQTAVSWFGPDQRWDLSPGFRLGKIARRPIGPECLYCHVDQVKPVAGADNRYHEPVFDKQLAIGCERCHGPGQLHVAERTANPEPAGVDTSIVNPKHLSPALQLAICEQCHLQGQERVARRGRDLFEFRPGLPFEHFASVHVRHPAVAEEYRSVGQFEQMEQSRCFTASGGRLLCTSCHDPHAVPEPATRDAHYRERCLKCHEPAACDAPRADREAKKDSCIACHMPRSPSSNIIHASVTDHRVPRVPDARPAGKVPPAGTVPLVRFRDGPLSPPPEERERDLGIALARYAGTRPSRELTLGADLRLLAADRLERSLALWPGDAEAWVALATVRTDPAKADQRLRAATAAVALAPQDESALEALAEAAVAAGKLDVAEQAATTRVGLNPRGFDPLIGRAFVYLARAEWHKAEVDSLAALRLHPFHPEARLYLAIALHNKGDRDGGSRELRTAAQLESDAKERQYLMDWFRRATR